MSTTTPPELEGFDQYKFGWHDPSNSVFEPKKGLSADVVREISALKGEPEWMTKFRLRSLEIFDRKPMPNASMRRHVNCCRFSRKWPATTTARHSCD